MSFEFLIEMAWKSALIAGVALALAATLRPKAAADRAAVLRVAVALLLLLPLFSLGLPKLETEAWAAEAAPVVSEMFAAGAPLADPSALGPFLAEPATDPTIWDDPSVLFLILYLGGAAMAAAGVGAGLWALDRWARDAREVDCPQWTEAFERARWAAGAPQGLRLLVSAEAPSPLSWGLLRPVILIDRDTFGEPEDADAILAHEIAHVVRRDWLVLMLTRIAAGLFWFNPLVWVLEREVVQQAEEAADIEAALWVEPARYAQTLVHWAQFNAGGLVPANSIAPSASALARRVRAILDARLRSTPSGSVGSFAAIAASFVFGVALTVVQLTPAAAEARGAPAARMLPAPAAPSAAPVPAVAPTPAAAPEPAALIVTGALPAAAPQAPFAPVVLAAVHPHPEAPPPPPRARSWPMPPDVRVTVPHVRVRTPPTPPTRVRTHAPGAPLDVDSLVAMRIHGVDAAYIRSLAEANAPLRALEADQLLAMRIHDVSAAYVRAMAAAGYAELSAEALVAMRIHGVWAHDARRAARARGRRLSAEELIDRAIHGADDD